MSVDSEGLQLKFMCDKIINFMYFTWEMRRRTHKNTWNKVTIIVLRILQYPNNFTLNYDNSQ